MIYDDVRNLSYLMHNLYWHGYGDDDVDLLGHYSDHQSSCHKYFHQLTDDSYYTSDLNFLSFHQSQNLLTSSDVCLPFFHHAFYTMIYHYSPVAFA